MARPVKETPMLYGQEARQFEMRMMNPPMVSKERKEEIKGTMNLCGNVVLTVLFR